ncbi:hypothetical protein Tco_1472427 [Tanacetum coccineum]
MDTNDSLIWKALLNLRVKDRRHIEHKVGNGENISIWYDKLCDIGPLCQRITNRDIYDARFDLKVSVDKLVWRSKNGSIKKFYVKQVWEDYNEDIPNVNWGKLVGFSQFRVWMFLKKKIKGADFPNDWSAIIDMMANKFQNRSIRSVISKIVLGAAIYFVWQERNKR